SPASREEPVRRHSGSEGHDLSGGRLDGDPDARRAGGPRGIPRSDRAREPGHRHSRRTRGQRLAARQHDQDCTAWDQPELREARLLPSGVAVEGMDGLVHVCRVHDRADLADLEIGCDLPQLPSSRQTRRLTPEWPYLPVPKYPRVGWPALGGRGNAVTAEARQVWRETPLEKKGEMDMRTRRAILFLTLVFVVFAAGYVSAQQALPGQDVKSLAGRWSGWLVPTTGSPNVPVEVQVEPDGSFTSTIGGSSMEKGTIKMVGGKLTSEGQLVT